MGRSYSRRSRRHLKLVQPLYCARWPDCLCASSWREWQVTFARWNDETQPAPSIAEIEEAIFLVFVMLSCVSERCPDPDYRRKAASELKARVFDRQRTIATDRALH